MSDSLCVQFMKTNLNLLMLGIHLSLAGASFGQPVPPTITATVSRQNWALDPGTASSFVVAASGTPPLSFQWRLDGRDLAGKTQITLALPILQPADGGDYTVVVSNAAGTVTSEPA